MNLDNKLFDEITEWHDKNPFYAIKASEVIFSLKKDEEELRLDLNLISNVRIIKNRVFSLNLLFTSIGLLICYFIKEFLEIYIIPYFLPAVIWGILFLSFSYKQFSHKLLINKQYLGFHELKVSRKNIVYAYYFLSLYKKRRIYKETCCF